MCCIRYGEGVIWDPTRWRDQLLQRSPHELQLGVTILHGSPMKDSSDELKWLHGGRIPALDGLRAVAILLVLVGHITSLQFPGTPARIMRIGDWGVELFFAIS